MGNSVSANKLSIVHKDTSGVVSFMPDVCLTPTGSGPVPIPYPNIAVSQDAALGAKTVSCEGNPVLLHYSTFSKSTGDEAGSCGGVASGCTKGAAEFIGCSFDVQIEGKGVARLTDLMLGNKGGVVNTPPAAEQQPPAPVAQLLAPGDLTPDKLTVIVTDGAGDPLPDARYVLITPEGKRIEGKTDGSGKIAVDDTVTGIGRIVFPDFTDAMVTES